MDEITISRKENFADSKLSPDCKFLVGADCVDIPEEITGHKIIFASASPVFKNMFFGLLPEAGDIKVPEIHPETFRTMVDFFYTLTITIISVEQAIDVWYIAEKYDIKELRKEIPIYLIKNITTQNVCCILQLAILYSNEIVLKKCHEVILGKTSQILSDASFLAGGLHTLSFLLDQDELTVSEVELFKALVQYDNAQKVSGGDVKSLQPSPTSPGKSRSDNLEVKTASVSHENVNDSCGEESANERGTAAQGGIKGNADNPVKELVKKIRFLTMTPKEFAECVGMSSLLSTSEALSIFVNISDPPANRPHQMPEGYSTIQTKRERKYYYIHASVEDGFDDHDSGEPLEFTLKLKSRKDMQIIGVQLNNRVVFSKYNDGVAVDFTLEIATARGGDLFRQDISVVESDYIQEVLFDHPVHISSGKWYTFTLTSEPVNLEEHFGYDCIEDDDATSTLEFGKDCNCQGFIRSIIFNKIE